MNKLTEVAKRDIQDLFNCGITLPDGSTGRMVWSERLDDADFLARLARDNKTLCLSTER